MHEFPDCESVSDKRVEELPHGMGEEGHEMVKWQNEL